MTILHTKYLSSRPYGFAAEDFLRLHFKILLEKISMKVATSLAVAATLAQAIDIDSKHVAN